MAFAVSRLTRPTGPIKVKHFFRYKAIKVIPTVYEVVNFECLIISYRTLRIDYYKSCCLIYRH